MSVFLNPSLPLYIAIFFRFMPFEFFTGLFSEDAALTLYFVVEYGSLALAVISWFCRLPFENRSIRLDVVCALVVLYVLWASISLLWARNPQLGVEKIGKYVIGLILLFLSINELRSWKQVSSFIFLIELSGWLLVAAGVFSALGPGYSTGERLSVFGINENQYALYLVMCVPCVIWSVHQLTGWRRWIRAALGIVFIILAMVLVLLTGSRGSTISLVIMLLAFWFAKPLRFWALVGSGMAACLVIAAPIVLLSLENRSAEKEGWGNELGGRDQLWEASLRLIRDHPLTGVGAGNGPSELINYVSSITDDYADRDSIPSHNPILEVGVDTGPFGVCIYLSIFAAAFWLFLRSRNERWSGANLFAAYFPLILGLTVSYVISWLKAGGVENDPSFFALLTLLILPSHLAGEKGNLAPFARC